MNGGSFTNNRATQGGAIDNEWYGWVTGTVFRHNEASADGGAFYSGYLSWVSDATFGENHAGSYGGAIFNESSESFGLPATTTVARSRIVGNSAAIDGGGLYNQTGNPPSQLPLTNSVVTDNYPDNCAPAGSVSGCIG